MKAYFLLALMFAAIAPLAKDNEIDLQSTITDVIVYQQGAQIKRHSRATIPAGNSVLRFTELHPSIDPNQIRFTGKGDFDILAMYYTYKTDTLGGRQTVAQRGRMATERAVLQSEIQVENSFMDIYTRELNMLQANQNFGSKEDGVKVADLIEAATFLRERFTDIRKQQLNIEQRVKELQAEIYRIDAKMAQLPTLQTETSLEYLVRVQAPKQTTGRLDLTYQVQGAGWYPSYDARVESVAEPLDLEYKANVYQNSGEDWENVNLTVSTGNPSLNKKKQNLIPWYISGNDTRYRNDTSNPNLYLGNQAYNSEVRAVSGQVMDDNGQPLIGANVVVYGTSNGTTTDINGYYTVEIPNNGQMLQWSYIGHQTVSLNVSAAVMNVVLKDQTQALEEVHVRQLESAQVLCAPEATMDVMLLDSDSRMKDFGYTGSTSASAPITYFAPPAVASHAAVTVSHSMTNTKFNIDSAYDIPSDGRQYAVTIQEHEVDVEYLYHVTPKLDETAFLTARMVDWQELDLLTGKMNIYFEDAYVGQSQLDMSTLTDTLSLSLGPDASLIVERSRLNAKSSKSLMGGKRKEVVEYEIVVRNAKSESVTILVDDQLPLTHSEEIEVERMSLDGAVEDEFTGKISWTLKVAAGKEKRLKFKYALRYPKNMLLAMGG